MNVIDDPKSVSDGSSADYYQLPENCKELQDLISHKDMNAQIGEIFRSCYRYGRASHSNSLRDAKKILFYAQAEVKRLEKLQEEEEREVRKREDLFNSYRKAVIATQS